MKRQSLATWAAVFSAGTSLVALAVALLAIKQAARTTSSLNKLRGDDRFTDLDLHTDQITGLTDLLREYFGGTSPIVWATLILLASAITHAALAVGFWIERKAPKQANPAPHAASTDQN